jgi:hypothetical protein
MMHVHGGSVLLGRLREAEMPGGFLEWCDVLCQGPAPTALDPDTWRRTRAAFLVSDMDAPADRDVVRDLEAQDRALEDSLETEELVLWFGPELFCQAILLYLLQWLGERRGRVRRLSLVCVDRYPGVDDHRSCTPSFLEGEQLWNVFARRASLGDAHLDMARQAWSAFTDPQPIALARLVASGTAPLEFLGAALARHLAELPAPGTGLSLTEQRVLDAIARGSRETDALLVDAQRDEERCWMTDTILESVLRRLSSGRAPLLARGDGFARLTPLARDVLAGRRDWLAENGIDRWVGGVHLTSERVWRWDASRGRLLAP